MPRMSRTLRGVDPDERQASNDRQVWVGLLCMFTCSAFLFSLVLFGEAAKETEEKTSGPIWNRETTTVVVPDETRLANLAGGVLLLVVSLALALLAYRIGTAPARRARAAVAPHAAAPSGHSSGGFSKEFLITTALGIVGLVIGAIAAWRT
jgi:hypothetical protein